MRSLVACNPHTHWQLKILLITSWKFALLVYVAIFFCVAQVLSILWRFFHKIMTQVFIYLDVDMDSHHVVPHNVEVYLLINKDKKEEDC